MANYNTEQIANDNISINDGTMTYFTESNEDLETVAREFYSTYDFNLDDSVDFGSFNATITNLDTDESANFYCDSQANFEWN